MNDIFERSVIAICIAFGAVFLLFGKVRDAQPVTTRVVTHAVPVASRTQPAPEVEPTAQVSPVSDVAPVGADQATDMRTVLNLAWLTGQRVCVVASPEDGSCAACQRMENEIGLSLPEPINDRWILFWSKVSPEWAARFGVTKWPHVLLIKANRVGDQIVPQTIATGSVGTAGELYQLLEAKK